MSRPMCANCQYPLSGCVCASIQPLSISNQVFVLQDPKEARHAKNSVKLLSLLLPDLKVVVGEAPADFATLRQFLAQSQKKIYLVYPAPESVVITEAQPDPEAILLFLDGTWRKVFKMLQLNPWLQAYPAVHLDLTSHTQYKIRKAPRTDSVSTLEAVALSLKAIDRQLDIAPFYKALDAMMAQQLSAMPAEVKLRYQ